MTYEHPTQEALVQALQEAFHYMKALGGESCGLLGYNAAFLQVQETLAEVERAQRSQWMAEHQWTYPDVEGAHV